MKIHFCDLCNESVPQADLDEGRAVLLAGRVICSTCETAMSKDKGAEALGPEGETKLVERVGEDTTIVDPGTAPPLPPHLQRRAGRSGSAVGLALGSLAVLLVVATAAYLHDWIGKHDARVDRRFEEQRDEIRSAVASLEQRIGQQSEALSSRVGFLATSLRGLEPRLAEVEDASRTSSEALDARLDEFGNRSETLTALAADLARQEDELAKLARTTSNLHDEVLRFAGRLREVETGRLDVAAAVAPDPGLEAADEGEPDWLPLVGDLASDDAGTRWQAVQALGATQDPRVAEHIAPLLRDSDLFVRMATARILGDLESLAGIPALIDALEDPEASVREAAVVSLRSITGKSFRFDPAAKESERSKRIRSWRDWWKKADRGS